MTVTVRLDSNDKYKTTVRVRSHTYHVDEPEDAGGTDVAAGPVEQLLGALGSCMAMTMKMYAERKKWNIDLVEVALDVERFKGKDYAEYDGDEQYVHEITEHVAIHGDLTPEQEERLLQIAKRCPVRRIISTPTFWKEDIISGIS